MVRSPSMPLATTTKPEGAASSRVPWQLAKALSGNTIHTQLSMACQCQSLTVGFPLYNPASPSSETERLAVIEDDALSTTIPSFVVWYVLFNHANLAFGPI